MVNYGWVNGVLWTADNGALVLWRSLGGSERYCDSCGTQVPPEEAMQSGKSCSVCRFKLTQGEASRQEQEFQPTKSSNRPKSKSTKAKSSKSKSKKESKSEKTSDDGL